MCESSYCCHPYRWMALLLLLVLWFAGYIWIGPCIEWLSTGAGLSTFFLLWNNPWVIQLLYQRPLYYEDLYICTLLQGQDIDDAGSQVLRRKFEQYFVIIATFLISLSTFGVLYFKLFRLHGNYNKAQVASLAAATLSGVNMIQKTLCKIMLSIIVRKHRNSVRVIKLHKQNVQEELSELSYTDPSPKDARV